MYLVLYGSKNEIYWDAVVYLNKVRKVLDTRSAIQVLGKYREITTKNVVIKPSVGYGMK